MPHQTQLFWEVQAETFIISDLKCCVYSCCDRFSTGMDKLLLILLSKGNELSAGHHQSWLPKEITASRFQMWKSLGLDCWSDKMSLWVLRTYDGLFSLFLFKWVISGGLQGILVAESENSHQILIWYVFISLHHNENVTSKCLKSLNVFLHCRILTLLSSLSEPSGNINSTFTKVSLLYFTVCVIYICIKTHHSNNREINDCIFIEIFALIALLCIISSLLKARLVLNVTD